MQRNLSPESRHTAHLLIVAGFTGIMAEVIGIMAGFTGILYASAP